MFSFGALKVSQKFYLKFQTKKTVSCFIRALASSHTAFETVRSNFWALHCQKSKLEIVNLKTVKRQNMATSSKEGDRKGNRLLKERSPYLLQHAYNPVDW